MIYNSHHLLILDHLPHQHLSGSGCPICSESKGEKIIRKFLMDNKIKFISQKVFDKCKFKNFLPFDFYIPHMNICIEFDGIQHYQINEFFGGYKAFEELKIKDAIKNKFCKNNKIKLIRLKNIKNIDFDLKNKLKLKWPNSILDIQQ